MLREICEVIHDSIIKLCINDHLNQNTHIEEWLSERSIENLESLLFNNKTQAFICSFHNQIVGVSNIDNRGELSLCYVHPAYTGKGIDHMILGAVENQAQELGLDEVKLISTTTAKNFYLSNGYNQYDEPIAHIGMTGYPLKKHIRS